MNPKQIVKISNFIGLISIIALVYWVIIFITIEVFGLKVFKENLSESFYFSIVGILALMTGSLIINIMFNLSRIAQKHNNDELTENTKSSNKIFWGIIISIPVIIGLLFFGDYLTAINREKMLISSAEELIKNNSVEVNTLLEYQYTKNWLYESQNIVSELSRIDKKMPNIDIIVQDTVNHKSQFLSFDNYNNISKKDSVLPDKSSYLFPTDIQERHYLNQIFDKKENKHRFSFHDGNYDLYYPIIKNDKIIILYFSDHQRYGKIGS